MARKYQNFLSSDWLPVEDAQYFSVQEFYVRIMLEEKIQTLGGTQRGRPVSNLTEVIQEIMQDPRGNYSLLLEGKLDSLICGPVPQLDSFLAAWRNNVLQYPVTVITIKISTFDLSTFHVSSPGNDFGPVCPSINTLTAKLRTCWIYNLCGSIRIYKDQISGIDPRYGSTKIYADLCGSIRDQF